MIQLSKEQYFDEKRKYRRLGCVFSVDFNIVRLQGDLVGLDWQKGSTTDISRGGVCVKTQELDEPTIRYLNKEDIYLELRIHAPLIQPPIKAVGQISWFHKLGEEHPKCFMIGLEFKNIAKEDLNRILAQAKGFINLFRLALAISLIVFILLIVKSFVH